MSGTKITPGFLLLLSFARCVIAADSGDDFSNNLFSDLAPLLSLLGEQVTMQFMSQAMGWTDNVILAMAPLGIITIIVSAIRVGGPSWLKALVGRARENLAVVEASLMSSTSKEVCELWNGQAVVRSMGAAPIGEFICLLPEGFRDGEDAKWGVPEVMTLEGAINTGLLDEIQPNLPETFYPTQRAEEGSARHKIRGPKIIVTRNPGADAPNISLNMNNQSGTGGLLWVAALGTVLQLGVLVFSGLATYHPRLMFLKDGRPIVPYAYPCTAVGTFLLVLGMMMCGHVVDSSTEETRYRTGRGSIARMVWLQKAGTVSDQVFGSFAIIARDDRTVVVTSRRAGKGSKPTGRVDRAVQVMVDTVTKLLYSSTVSETRKKSSQSTTAASEEQGHTAILASKTVLGVLMGLCGFIVQFIGLRGMHWSASVAQLGATLVMTAFRAWVRLGLAKSAEARRLIPGFELDWLATALGDADKASWLATSNSEKIRSDWSVISGRGQSTLKRWGGERGTEPEFPDSKAQALMGVRADLGMRSQWCGLASGEAKTIARAIEIVMDKLIGPFGVFTWTLGTRYAGSSNGAVGIGLTTEDYKWTVDVDALDAALSLWLYSAIEHEDCDVAEWPPNPDPHPLKKVLGESLRLLGPSTPSLRRDLQWWTTRDAPNIIQVEMYDKAIKRGVHGSWISYKKTNPSIRRYELVDMQWNESWDRWYNTWSSVAYHRLIGYEMVDGNAAQNREDWADLDCKPSDSPSLRSDDDSNSTYSTCSKIQKEGGEPLLAVALQQPIMPVYTHAIFSDFMWAMAKEAAKRPGENITELRTDDSSSVDTRGSFMLWNRRLSTMAQEIQNTRLGSLDQIYLSIIPALSVEGLLPKPDEVVALVKQYSEQMGRMNHWKQASDAWYWLLQPANMFPEDGEFYEQAQYEARDEFGRSPLHIAALASDYELAKLLIRSLADVDLGDMRGGTALHVAATNGEEAIVRLLIANGANMDAADMDGLTPVYVAAARKQDAIASLLLESGANKDAADHQGSTLLHIAASREDEAVITLLLDHGADKDAVNDQHQTPLHTAAATNNAAITRLLIDSGANTEAADDDGQTPLHIAATAMDSTVAELLLDKGGADAEARDHEGRTPLHVASPTAGALLLQRGADKHARDKEGREPVLTDQSQEARDYQAQLVLLEQQNRKRMQMARRELG